MVHLIVFAAAAAVLSLLTLLALRARRAGARKAPAGLRAFTAHLGEVSEVGLPVVRPHGPNGRRRLGDLIAVH